MIRLDPGEELLFETRRHPLPALGSSVAGAVGTVLVALVALVADVGGAGLGAAGLLFVGAAAWLGIAYLRYRRDVVVVTTQRLVHRSGILSITSSETAITRIGDILIDQGLLPRTLGYGNVEIVSGTESGLDALRDVRDPHGLAAAIRRATIGSR
jgi:membrane protein YdbS with pleckstrin-like domain